MKLSTRYGWPLAVVIQIARGISCRSALGTRNSLSLKFVRIFVSLCRSACASVPSRRPFRTSIFRRRHQFAMSLPSSNAVSLSRRLRATLFVSFFSMLAPSLLSSQDMLLTMPSFALRCLMGAVVVAPVFSLCVHGMLLAVSCACAVRWVNPLHLYLTTGSSVLPRRPDSPAEMTSSRMTSLLFERHSVTCSGARATMLDKECSELAIRRREQYREEKMLADVASKHGSHRLRRRHLPVSFIVLFIMNFQHVAMSSSNYCFLTFARIRDFLLPALISRPVASVLL